MNVTQSNFKEIRQKAGITVREIANICNLSQQTVLNFENCKGRYTDTNARSYNSDMMIQTLESLISKKEEKEEKEVKKRKYEYSDPKMKMTDISRIAFITSLKGYLKQEHITLKDFCSMCGFDDNTLNESYAKKYPYLAGKQLDKICSAAGWSTIDIVQGNCFKSKKGEKSMSYVATQKSIIEEGTCKNPKFGELTALTESPIVRYHNYFERSVEKRNTKLTFSDGKYFEEYELVEVVKKEISKEQFLELVEKEG